MFCMMAQACCCVLFCCGVVVLVFLGASGFVRAQKAFFEMIGDEWSWLIGWLRAACEWDRSTLHSTCSILLKMEV